MQAIQRDRRTTLFCPPWILNSSQQFSDPRRQWMWSIIGMSMDGCIHCPKAYLFFYLMRCRSSFPCPADLLKILNGPRCPSGIYIRLLWTLQANARILGPPGNYPFRMQGVVLPWHRGRGERVPTWPCCQDSWLPEQAPGFRDRNDTFSLHYPLLSHSQLCRMHHWRSLGSRIQDLPLLNGCPFSRICIWSISAYWR